MIDGAKIIANVNACSSCTNTYTPHLRKTSTFKTLGPFPNTVVTLYIKSLVHNIFLFLYTPSGYSSTALQQQQLHSVATGCGTGYQVSCPLP